jgi:hypothetical protein
MCGFLCLDLGSDTNYQFEPVLNVTIGGFGVEIIIFA